ncbi:DPY30 domain-containing protein 2 [Perognathus longimembris pacificus]|uniref:DPY30 domain-containing protein 2 n=1 Tax=Perognathus longimembris pacificus TaxID=214514 RepID=UPI002019D1C3|nr:DPY30 domain-containing protein 2 [Perognathus longimembris pacificus]
MESAYLKRCFGNSLTQALAEVAKVRPSDPIEYLAHWLYHYRKITKADEENKQKMIQLQEECDCGLKDEEMLKQEAHQTQRRCARCHKKLVSTTQAVLMKEDTESLEKALNQASLPGPSNAISGTHQQVLPTPPAHQTELNLKTPQEINA